jgi:hypothetical protein
MEWVMTAAAALGLFVLLLPVLVLLGTVFVLVPLAHLAPPPAMVARATFDCPYSRRRVSATFLTVPGQRTPADVVTCSLFPRGIRCTKPCLGLAATHWAPSPVVPPRALIADGVAPRLAA